MSRRWFWPLVIAATALLSLAGGSVLSVVMLYAVYDVPGTPQLTENSVIQYTYYVDVHPALYVGAALVAALGTSLLVLAARLR